VLLDEHLAPLYGVEVRVLNQAVKRNIERFPPDFMFQLTPEEDACLRSQFVILKAGRGSSDSGSKSYKLTAIHWRQAELVEQVHSQLESWE
jgi:hypothetical protein